MDTVELIKEKNARIDALNKKNLELQRRNTRLVQALRDAPMPLIESLLSGAEWDMAYDNWWHEHASEDGILRLLRPKD